MHRHQPARKPWTRRDSITVALMMAVLVPSVLVADTLDHAAAQAALSAFGVVAATSVAWFRTQGFVWPSRW